jgi:hypothetical protein
MIDSALESSWTPANLRENKCNDAMLLTSVISQAALSTHNLAIVIIDIQETGHEMELGR